MSDGAIAKSATGVDGNSYTSSVSKEALTNDDFLKLMLEELKQQDPTKPNDSAAIMDSQLKMSQIQANKDMTDTMSAMSLAYASSALSTAANLIGRIVEDGTKDDEGLLKSYKIETVENKNGEIYANARQIVGIKDALANSTTEELAMYDADGYIYDGETKLEYKLSLDPDGRFTYNEDGTLKIVDENNEVVTDEAITDKYVFAGSSAIYAKETSTIAFNKIAEVR